MTKKSIGTGMIRSGGSATLIAAALREFVRDNDLGVSVDRCLCVYRLGRSLPSTS
jgi:hypothetical protein